MCECDCDQYSGLGEHFCGRPNDGEVETLRQRVTELEAQLHKAKNLLRETLSVLAEEAS